MATRWKTCVDLRANLILTKVNASHRKSTQVHASPGQTKSQAGPSLQLASTCVSVWPGLKAKLKACYNYSVFLFRMLDPTPTPPPPPLFQKHPRFGVSKSRLSRSISLAVYFLYIFAFLVDHISCRSYVGNVYRMRSIAVSRFSVKSYVSKTSYPPKYQDIYAMTYTVLCFKARYYSGPVH